MPRTACPATLDRRPLGIRSFVSVAALAAVLVAPALADAHHGAYCHHRACVERVAMHQCSSSRPIACIRRAALHWRVPFALQLAIARCESGLRAWALNGGGSGSSGLMQFMPGTFAATPYGRRWILSAKWNALAGAWLLRRSGTGPWVSSRPCWG